MNAVPTAEIDARFSDAEAGATPWPEVESTLEGAELYWLTTVRADGRPHVTPLIGVWPTGRSLLHRPGRAEGPQPRTSRTSR